MKILINGAGIAGLTAAYWLHHHGFEVTLIEKTQAHFHSSGYVIDVWGPGFSVLEKMFLSKKLQSKNHPLSEFIFIDATGKESSRFSIPKFREIHHQRVLTLLRGELEETLHEAISSRISIQWGTTIEQMHLFDEKVCVNFSNQKQETYDYVIGADGVHSHLRELIFGREKQFSQYLGFQLAAGIFPNTTDINNALCTYSAIGKQVTVCPLFDHRLACYFVYRCDDLILPDPKSQFLEVFHKEGWVIPSLLESAESMKDIFFDGLSQIEMPTWHQNRVVLLGDACHCLTLMGGQGASMAMAAAYVLAKELSSHRNDYLKAFSDYESTVKPEMTAKQSIAREFLKYFIPTEATQNMSRNYVTRNFFKKMNALGVVDEYCKNR